MEKTGGMHPRQKEYVHREEGRKNEEQTRPRDGWQSIWLEFRTGECWSEIQGSKVTGPMGRTWHKAASPALLGATHLFREPRWSLMS